MINKSLYQISAELELLNSQLAEQDGELTPEMETALAITQDDLNTKGANYGLVILSNTHDIEAIDAEIKRLSEKKKFLANANDRLKGAIYQAMVHFGIEKISTPIVSLSFRKSESVEIIDQAMIPEPFLVTKTTYTPDKAAIKSVLKDGGEVPGAVLLSNKNLQIR